MSRDSLVDWSLAGQLASPGAGVSGEAGAGGVNPAGSGPGGTGIIPETVYYLHDRLGSVIGLVAEDGTLVERYTYDAYGRTHIERLVEGNLTFWPAADPNNAPFTTSAFDNPWLWTGQRYDAAPQLYHFLYRTHSPRLGRWLQHDPLGYVDGVNLYEYVGGMPTGAVDPLGLYPTNDDLDRVINGGGSAVLGTRAVCRTDSSNERRDQLQEGMEFVVEGKVRPERVIEVTNPVFGEGSSYADDLATVKATDKACFYAGLPADLAGVPALAKAVAKAVAKKFGKRLLARWAAKEVAEEIIDQTDDDVGRYVAKELVESEGDSCASKCARELAPEVAEELAGTIDDLLEVATRNPEAKEVVLGKFSKGGVSYVDVAASRNSTYFQLDDWDELVSQYGREYVDEVNRAFIHTQDAAGKSFVFSHDPMDAANLGASQMAQEVEWLKELGYTSFVVTLHPSAKVSAIFAG